MRYRSGLRAASCVLWYTLSNPSTSRVSGSRVYLGWEGRYGFRAVPRSRKSGAFVYKERAMELTEQETEAIFKLRREIEALEQRIKQNKQRLRTLSKELRGLYNITFSRPSFSDRL